MASRRSSTSSSSSSDSGVLVSTPTSSSSEPSIPGQPFVLPSRPKDTEPTKPSEQIKIASASTPNEPAKNTDLGKEKKAVKTTKPVQPAKKGKQTKSSTDLVIAITPAKKIVKSTTSSPYWLQFPSFKHDCNAALNGQFSKLAAHSGWKRKSKRYIEERTACYAAEYQHFFHPDGWSEGGKLEVWKVLCGAVGIKEEESITKCKKVSQSTITERRGETKNYRHSRKCTSI